MTILRLTAIALSLLAIACLPNARPTIDPVRMAQLWQPPNDLERRDLVLGVGGSTNAPDPDDLYEHIADKEAGTQPGYDVKDSKGREWRTKLGPEARPEVVVSRLLWAIGYHQPSVYYVPQWTLVKDGKRIPQAGARFRLDDTRNLGGWSWRKNPFLHTREFAGLFVFMVMVNNWDLKALQNALYRMKDDDAVPRERFIVKDLGASFGRSTWVVSGTKADPDGFEDDMFIEGVEGNRVRFAYQGAWREPQLLRGIAPADVRWTAELLSRLTPKQWSDAFRTAGFGEAEAERYIARMRQKIGEGLRLGSD